MWNTRVIERSNEDKFLYWELSKEMSEKRDISVTQYIHHLISVVTATKYFVAPMH
jgi:hypothetical protein